MPIGVDPQTGQPVMLPYPEEQQAGGGMPPGLADLLGGGGPPGMPPAPPGAGPPGSPGGEQPPDFTGLISTAMDSLRQAVDAARDEEEAEAATKLLLGAQQLLTRQQKDTRSAIGMSTQQKLMSRGG